MLLLHSSLDISRCINRLVYVDLSSLFSTLIAFCSNGYPYTARAILNINPFDCTYKSQAYGALHSFKFAIRIGHSEEPIKIHQVVMTHYKFGTLADLF